MEAILTAMGPERKMYLETVCKKREKRASPTSGWGRKRPLNKSRSHTPQPPGKRTGPVSVKENPLFSGNHGINCSHTTIGKFVER